METPYLDEYIEWLSGDPQKHIEELKEYKEIKEALSIHDVSQQRELLAFRKWQKDNWKDVYLYSDEFMISEFKKANCG